MRLIRSDTKNRPTQCRPVAYLTTHVTLVQVLPGLSCLNPLRVHFTVFLPMNKKASSVHAGAMSVADSSPAPQANAQTLLSQAGTLHSLKAIGVSSIADTLCGRHHSKDFSYARGDYLRGRVTVIAILFLVLLPFWAVLDFFLLPDDTRTYTLVGRIFMMAGLVLTVFLARGSAGRFNRARVSAGLLFFLPAAFYVLVLFALTRHPGTHDLVGYSFIPYMLVVMLSLFPFTLIESGVVGAVLLLAQGASQYLTGNWLTAAGLQESWLLFALLTIALTSNYFHLGLLLRLYREATHDPLTGLLNRGALAHSLDQALQARGDKQMALLMMDLDHFKRINDQYGHPVGDRVLAEFARLLRQVAGKNDFAARYGGEEFVVVLTQATRAQALETAERIRAQAEITPVTDHHGRTLNFTVSIGVAMFRPGETLEIVARRADERLYEAKKLSRNCVVGA